MNAKAHGDKGVVKTEVELTAIEKVRKLMEFSEENGATEAEIENAMKLAQRLMLKHNLEMGDIELTTSDISETSIPCTWKKGNESKLFEYDLLNAVAEAFNCKVVRAGDSVNRIHKIVGLLEDRQTTESTYYKILPQVRHLTKERYKESSKELSFVRFTISYQSGFIAGLREKLAEDKATLMRSKDGKKYDLIIVTKDALVDAWVAQHMKVKSTEKIKKVDPQAFKTGKEDGSDKGLNEKLPAKKPVEKKTEPKVDSKKK